MTDNSFRELHQREAAPSAVTPPAIFLLNGISSPHGRRPFELL
ncbi:hypothetical protein [Prescottella agglutinans]